jgi:NAD(P)-dependent dehydrogenase (short-subunit alcohol dehydrogenase family)
MAEGLRGKVALVTGASRGIGAAIARLFAEAGAAVYANYPPQDAEQHIASMNEWVSSSEVPLNSISPICADVSKSQQVNRMFQTVRDDGQGLDILVNNAGIARDRTLAKMSDDEWSSVISVNLSGVFYSCRAAIPLLRAGGTIISISSVVAHSGGFGVSNYAASKAGILALTRCLAIELAPKGLTANAICPGMVDTSLSRNLSDAVRQRFLQKILLQRAAEPSEIAQLALFLASPGAGYITGQAFDINGGMYLRS